jgi:LPXTG-motif cell wall-anchored protein
MRRTRIFTATLAVAALALAGFALGQNADPNTAAPTKNDYRLRVVEPAEGATITGSQIQVVVDLRPFPEVGGERRDVNSMPRPRVDVFLDNENKGTLQEGQNVMTLDAVGVGSHKLVVLAKNLSGEVIDRKEIKFTAEAGTTVAQSNVETHRAPATDREAVAAPAASAPPPPIARLQSAPPPPAPAAPAPATSMPRPETTTAQMETLPETASSTPLLAVAGLGLLVTGLALRRRS